MNKTLKITGREATEIPFLPSYIAGKENMLLEDQFLLQNRHIRRLNPKHALSPLFREKKKTDTFMSISHELFTSGLLCAGYQNNLLHSKRESVDMHQTYRSSCCQDRPIKLSSLLFKGSMNTSGELKMILFCRLHHFEIGNIVMHVQKEWDLQYDAIFTILTPSGPHSRCHWCYASWSLQLGDGKKFCPHTENMKTHELLPSFITGNISILRCSQARN